jgi:CIC family chloride channel protein
MKGIVDFIRLRIKLGVKYAQNRLTPKQFIFFSSILVGLSVGIAAVLLKVFVHFVYYLATYEKLSNFKYFYLFLPFFGILITVLVVRKFFRSTFEKGLAQIHYGIAQKSSFIKEERMYDQVVTSSITVGTGGSVGLEAPIVITGAAFGSNYAKEYHLNYNERTLLLACGIAAGIAAAFNAPIAGVLFALEVLLLDITIAAFTPLILAAASGALVSRILQSGDILLSFRLTEDFNYLNVPFYAILGVLAGLMAVYHSRMFLKVERLFHRREGGLMRKALIGGLGLAILIAVFPSLFGEGFQSIKSLANHRPDQLLDQSILKDFITNEWTILLFVGAIFFLKAIAAGLTIGGGGNGGNFAPSMFVGAYLGYFFARLCELLKITDLPENNFTLVGMAGILSGMYHAPLTAIFLIAEITGGYSLMIPLMIVSSISYAISKYFEPYSMDMKNLAKSGEVFTDDRDSNILTTMSTKSLINTENLALPPNTTLGELVEKISISEDTVFPIVHFDGQLLGLVFLSDIREVMFKTELYEKIHVNDLMVRPKAIVKPDSSMTDVMKIFDNSDLWVIPVIENGKYVGLLSKREIFNAYRAQLKKSTIG